MKNLESIKNDLYGKDQTLDSKTMNSVFAGGTTKTKGSKTKWAGNGDNSDPHESDDFEEIAIE
ncbi:hypothetical protein [Aquimarina celericrescens]|uniref:Uncharacterized protein n=1 Tax=Aquimarina celericrescens TaxID=1964542 RepID=A0ABW5AUB2_9FLAO|nr:hypothetical protein [Aquimarina celericrescens]